MDKNTVIGFILIAAVLIGFGYLNKPSAEQLAEQARQDSIATVKKDSLEKASLESDVVCDTIAETVGDSAMESVPETFTTLQNKLISLDISNKGGVMKKAVVKNYEDLEGNNNVTLFEGADQGMNFLLAGKTENIITKDLTFDAINATDTTVTMKAAIGPGSLIISYLLPHDSYLLQMTVKAEGLAGMFAPDYNQMGVNWQEKAKQQEKSFTFENRYASLTYKEANEGTDYLSETSEKIDVNIEEALDWVAFKNQYFSTVLIPKKIFAANSSMTSIPQEKSTGYLKQFEAKMKTDFDPTGNEPTKFEIYIGPNNFRLLQKVSDKTTLGKDLELQKLIYLGWPLVRWINRFFTLYVFDILRQMNIPMGIILILITLLLKAITYPLVKKSYMSSAKMRVLKPRLEEETKDLNGPDQKMEKQQKMMQLYSQYGVSPMGGCLPALIQMPIWIAMFNFVPNAIELRRQSFLWIDDLSTYDPIVEWGTNIWLIGDHLSLTCILFCAANVLYSIMTMRQQKDQMVGQQAEQMKMMRWMMYLMPVMFFFMFNDYSAGLNFYYFISLFFSAAIMWILRKTTNDEKLYDQLMQKYKERKADPKFRQKQATGFAARLQAMAEEQKRRQQKN
ncbi:MAG: membrane protein insertase YidC [Prevotella sp.]|nr:membrane protein insertase YidC [Candidatus Equicola stercoris]